MACGERFFLGLDTSCYPTSGAVVDGSGRIGDDFRQLLRVKTGERGLRQPEALFPQVINLP